MEPSQSQLKPLVYAATALGLVCRYMMSPTSSRKVWLTFDDGPHPAHTTAIFDTLRERRLQAAFFYDRRAHSTLPRYC